mmetsp:Transcript_13257/g.29203  ORF Transcript_13257/g.29203 Transcript_13257/m.29203 type:complete len:123 (+) Transcript_13257:1560-1928(+)
MFFTSLKELIDCFISKIASPLLKLDVAVLTDLIFLLPPATGTVALTVALVHLLRIALEALFFDTMIFSLIMLSISTRVTNINRCNLSAETTNSYEVKRYPNIRKRPIVIKNNILDLFHISQG